MEPRSLTYIFHESRRTALRFPLAALACAGACACSWAAIAAGSEPPHLLASAVVKENAGLVGVGERQVTELALGLGSGHRLHLPTAAGGVIGMGVFQIRDLGGIVAEDRKSVV